MPGSAERDRHHTVIRLLEATGRVSVPDLAERFGVSKVTVRKDLASVFHECGQQGERGLCGLGGPVVLVGQVGDPIGVWRPMGLHVWSGRSRVRHDSPMPGW